MVWGTKGGDSFVWLIAEPHPLFALFAGSAVGCLDIRHVIIALGCLLSVSFQRPYSFHLQILMTAALGLWWSTDRVHLVAVSALLALKIVGRHPRLRSLSDSESTIACIGLSVLLCSTPSSSVTLEIEKVCEVPMAKGGPGPVLHGAVSRRALLVQIQPLLLTNKHSHYMSAFHLRSAPRYFVTHQFPFSRVSSVSCFLHAVPLSPVAGRSGRQEWTGRSAPSIVRTRGTPQLITVLPGTTWIALCCPVTAFEHCFPHGKPKCMALDHLVQHDDIRQSGNGNQTVLIQKGRLPTSMALREELRS